MKKIKFREWNGIEMNYEPIISIISTASINERFIDNDFMQFTGIKDNCGIDIYEGDILEYKNYLGRHHKYMVFYKDGGLCINIHDSDFHKKPKDILFYSPCADMQTKGWVEQCKVIGNIYENPDLLKPFK